MESSQPETRPCAHCGGTIAPDDTTCATCGRAYIPEPEHREEAPPLPEATDLPPPPTVTGDTGPEIPPPAEFASVAEESRMWAMGAHLSALAGILLGGLPAFLGPLIVWLLRRDQSDPFATDHAREALNFNISVIIYAVAAVMLGIVTFGIGFIVVVPLGLVAFVAYIVLTIRAAVAASRGEYYTYPLTIRLVS